jgi:hypothetical protein
MLINAILQFPSTVDPSQEMTYAKYAISRSFANFLTVASYTPSFVLVVSDTMCTLKIIFYQPFRGRSTADFGPVMMLASPEQSL